MNGTPDTTGTGPTTTFDECHLNELVGNNFFFGQLLTPRVFAREQALHASRTSNLTQFVLGSGIVCGLDVEISVETRSVSETGTEAEFLDVTVDPGLALDCCGRQLVLEREATESHRTDDPAVSTPDVLSVYLAHKRCTFEPVAAVGVENACEERCVDSLFVERGVLDTDFDEPSMPYKSTAYIDYPTEAEVGQPPEPLSAAPAGTFLVERWPDGIPTAAEPVAIGVIGGGDERLDNASTDEVELAAGDVLVSSDGRRFVVSATDVRTLTRREPGAEPEVVLLALDPSPVVSSTTDTTVSGRTTARSGTEVTISVQSPPGSSAPFLLQATATVEDNSFTATFAVDDPIPVDTPLAVTARILNETGGPEVSATTDTVVVEAGSTSAIEASDEEPALARVSRSYYANRPLTTCETCGEDHRVLLGWFTRTGDTWGSTSFTRGPLVYNNDLLHAAIVRHATNFRNPHETALVVNRTEESLVGEERNLTVGETYARGERLLLFGLDLTRTYELHEFTDNAVGDLIRTIEPDTDGDAVIETTDLPAGRLTVTTPGEFPLVFSDGNELVVELDEEDFVEATFILSDEARTTGAYLTTNALPTTDEDVLIFSPDETVSITPGFEGRSLEFEVAGLDGMRRRLDALEAYVLRKAIEYKPTAYSVVEETFGDSVRAITDEITRLSTEALGDGDYRDEAAFGIYVDAVYDQEEALRALVAGENTPDGRLATQESLDRFAASLSRLETARGAVPRDVLDLALTQDGVSEAAEWLVREGESEPEPGRVLECVVTRNIPADTYEDEPNEITLGHVTFSGTELDSITYTANGDQITELAIQNGLAIRFDETDFATVTVWTEGRPVSLIVERDDGTEVQFEADGSTETHTFEVDLDGELFDMVRFEGAGDEQSVVRVCVAV